MNIFCFAGGKIILSVEIETGSSFVNFHALVPVPLLLNVLFYVPTRFFKLRYTSFNQYSLHQCCCFFVLFGRDGCRQGRRS